MLVFISSYAETLSLSLVDLIIIIIIRAGIYFKMIVTQLDHYYCLLLAAYRR
jgi:hypothetical protein